MNHWAAEILGATSVLIALVLVLRGAVARQFRARAAYALWLAPLLRFVVPSMTPPMVAPQIWIDTSSAAASTLAPVNLVWVSAIGGSLGSGAQNDGPE